MGENIKVCSLSKFQLPSTVLSIIVTMLYIRSSDCVHLYNWMFMPTSLYFFCPPIPESTSLLSLFLCSVIFFIHSSTDGHLGCFHLLIWWIMLLWAWRYRCQCHFEILFSFPSDKYTEVRLQDHMLVLFLIFWRNSYCFL